MKTNLILQKVAFLHGLIDPSWIDGNPGQPGPIFRTAMIRFRCGRAFCAISALTCMTGPLRQMCTTLVRNLYQVRRMVLPQVGKMATISVHPGLRAVPGLTVSVSLTSPHPEPWLEHVTPAMNDIVLAHALRELASLTSSEKASNGIRQVGETIVKAASNKLFDEYCGTPVKTHVPVPRPKAVAAA